jgi:uncharacterized protein
VIRFFFDRFKKAGYYRAFLGELSCMDSKKIPKSIREFDAWSFCKTGGRLCSTDFSLEFPRLRPDGILLSCLVEAWEVSGRVNVRSECVLSLSGRFSAAFACGVCAQAVHENLEFSRRLVLKTSEAEADSCEDYDDHDDVDVISCSGAVNLLDWLEDEILLVFPMFPRHEACGDAQLRQELDKINASLQEDSAEEQAQEVQRPFANLAGLVKARKQ